MLFPCNINNYVTALLEIPGKEKAEIVSLISRKIITTSHASMDLTEMETENAANIIY